ncbi:DNA primase [Candidatus Gracilibacteria bacterium]|nr:DNA primase [Candidatus Gracilibacteria bacterium]
MADNVEEIKGRLGIKDVVSQYVELKKAGLNWKGLCPFHSESTPSFVVSPEKQICHCFGCNRGGDIFTFVQEVEGVTFSESLQILADRAGVTLDKKDYKKKGPSKSEKDEYFKAHDLACELFEKTLWKTNKGAKVLDYLKRRGLTEDTIKEFRIGFAPDSFNALYPILLEKGISKNVLLKSGFISSKDITAEKFYDKFRSRLMFPIFDYLGRICGFGGRALSKEQTPKYLNSPENPVYSKSKVMYGLSFAKKAIKEEGSVLLVEGYFDVILPFQEGVKNVVATSGTALTKDHAKMLKRITKKAVSCFDKDNAGFDATKRAYSVLQGVDIAMKTVGDFDAKDPAEFVIKDGDKFKSMVKEAQGFVSFYIDQLVLRHDVTVLEGRVAVIRELLPLYKEMSPTVKDFYVRELSKKLMVSEQSLYDEIDGFKLSSNHPAKQDPTVVVQVRKYSVDELLIALVLSFPKLFKNLEKILPDQYFEGEINTIYKEISDQYNRARGQLDRWDFDKGFLATVADKLKVWVLYIEEKYQDFAERTLSLEIEKLVDKAQRDRKARRLKEIHLAVLEAEKVSDEEKINGIVARAAEVNIKLNGKNYKIHYAADGGAVGKIP